MKRFIEAIVLGGFSVLIVAIAIATGMLTLSGPSLPKFTSVDVRLSLPDEATITNVEPIHLDCRARVFAEVPVEGKREHESFGVVYRTDRITMHAYGDVDTCVDGSATDITLQRDGTTEVVIPGESIVFVRPRVDAVRTASSVDVDKDMVGKLVDAFPWVDDNLGLTPLAYAYAQNVIGGSECMQTAFEVTEGLLVDAYHQQLVDQGADPDRITVRIEGSPDFGDPTPVDLGDVDMQAGAVPAVCVASDPSETNQLLANF